MSSSHSTEGIIIQPLIGAWSDRLRTKLGRRKPFMLFAIPLCSLFMILTPMAASHPDFAPLHGLPRFKSITGA